MRRKILVAVEPSFFELALEYLNSKKREAPKIRKLVEREAFSEISKIGHSLKGNGKTYGFSELSILGDALERYAQSSEKVQLYRVMNEFEGYLSDVEVAPAISGKAGGWRS